MVSILLQVCFWILLLTTLHKVTSAYCEAGDDQSPSDAITSIFKGTYLNTQYPITCEGYITKWHYCYHNESSAPASTHLMVVAVWSYHSNLDMYVIHNDSPSFIIRESGESSGNCNTKNLELLQYVSVSEGDLIGVVLSYDPFPVLSFSSTSRMSLIRSNNTVPANICASESTIPLNVVLHLQAIIETKNEPSTVAAPENSSFSTAVTTNCGTTLTSTENPTSSENKESPNTVPEMDSKTIKNTTRSLYGRDKISITVTLVITFSVLLALGAILMTVIGTAYCVDKRSKKRLAATLSGIQNAASSNVRNDSLREDNVPGGASPNPPYYENFEHFPKFPPDDDRYFAMEHNMAYENSMQLESETCTSSSATCYHFDLSEMPIRNKNMDEDEDLQMSSSDEGHYDYVSAN